MWSFKIVVDILLTQQPFFLFINVIENLHKIFGKFFCSLF